MSSPEETPEQEDNRQEKQSNFTKYEKKFIRQERR